MIFKRKLYNEMLRWKTEKKGSTALLIKGARRVGKSTLVEEFAKKEYKSYILIDFYYVFYCFCSFSSSFAHFFTETKV